MVLQCIQDAFTNFSVSNLKLLSDENPALGLSMKYMRIRSLSLVPQMITFVCFGAFRGMLGTSTIRN